MITFMHPWAFLLLIPVILLALLMIFRKRPAIRIPSVIPLKKAGNAAKFRMTVMEIALLLAMILLVCAAARPRKAGGSRIIRGKGVDIVLALDMSGSMAIYDKPESMSSRDFVSGISNGSILNRLETAKAEIRRFIENRPNDRIGLIGFSDLAYSFVPPTFDHALLLERLKDLSPGDLGDATGIASPVGTGARQLKDAPSPRRVLVLFTDGANTAANRLTPQDAARAAKEFNVIIHTVGIGSPYCFAIDPYSGRLIQAQSDLDDKLLKELADISGGNYYAATDADGMKKVMDEINSLERTDHTNPQITLYKEYTPYLCIAAAAIVLLGAVAAAIGRVRLP